MSPTEKSPGQIAYEAERAEWPLFHTGEERPDWEALGVWIRATWEMCPTPRLAPAGTMRALTPEQKADL